MAWLSFAARLQLRRLTSGDPESQILDLERERITVQKMRVLARAIATSAELRSVRMRSCAITNDGYALLADGLRRCGKVAHLAFSQCDADGVAQVLAGLIEHQTLVHLECVYCDAGRSGASALSTLLGPTARLQIIDFRENSIRCDGARAIASALKTNRTVRSVNLGTNRICEDGAVAIGGAVEENDTLETLLLNCNEIGNAGTVAIASALQNARGRTRVTCLEVACNKITRQGADAIAEMLTSNTTMTRLGIGANKLLPGGVERIVSALETHQSITWLDLSYTSAVHDVVAIPIAKMLRTSVVLEELLLNDHYMTATGISLLVHAVKDRCWSVSFVGPLFDFGDPIYRFGNYDWVDDARMEWYNILEANRAERALLQRVAYHAGSRLTRATVGDDAHPTQVAHVAGDAHQIHVAQAVNFWIDASAAEDMDPDDFRPADEHACKGLPSKLYLGKGVLVTLKTNERTDDGLTAGAQGMVTDFSIENGWIAVEFISTDVGRLRIEAKDGVYKDRSSPENDYVNPVTGRKSLLFSVSDSELLGTNGKLMQSFQFPFANSESPGDERAAIGQGKTDARACKDAWRLRDGVDERSTIDDVHAWILPPYVLPGCAVVIVLDFLAPSTLRTCKPSCYAARNVISDCDVISDWY